MSAEATDRVRRLTVLTQLQAQGIASALARDDYDEAVRAWEKTGADLAALAQARQAARNFAPQENDHASR